MKYNKKAVFAPKIEGKVQLDKNLLHDILMWQAPSMSEMEDHFIEWITQKSFEFGANVAELDKFGNLYITKGNSEKYGCAVSHVDQVHNYVDGFQVYEQNGIMFAWSSETMLQHGVGGDDKCGIYLCLEMLRHFENFKCVFFKSEEVGCLGSAECDLSFFDDVTFVLQGDRRGDTTDFINHTNGVECTSGEFEDAIFPFMQNYGYGFNTGSITDVGELKCNGLDICCANVSCGYYNAHTDEEIIWLNGLENCLNLFFDLFSNVSYQRWEHKAQSMYNHRSFSDRDDYWKTDYKGKEPDIMDVGDLYEQIVNTNCPRCNMQELDILEMGVATCCGCLSEFRYDSSNGRLIEELV